MKNFYTAFEIVALPGEQDAVIVSETNSRSGEISRVWGSPGGTPIPQRPAPAATVQPIVIDFQKVEQIRAESEQVRRMFRPGIIDMRRVAQVRADTLYIRSRLSNR